VERHWARVLVGKILDLPPTKSSSDMAGLGNPILGPCARATPTFQLTHRDVIAISMGRAVGIDVERIRTDFDVDEIATLFSANARNRLASLEGRDTAEALFASWRRKETYLKARGVGLSAPLDQFDVSLLRGEEPRLLATGLIPPGGSTLEASAIMPPPSRRGVRTGSSDAGTGVSAVAGLAKLNYLILKNKCLFGPVDPGLTPSLLICSMWPN
jgi:4'-phosphopantetheinyl transferase